MLDQKVMVEYALAAGFVTTGAAWLLAGIEKLAKPFPLARELTTMFWVAVAAMLTPKPLLLNSESSTKLFAASSSTPEKPPPWLVKRQELIVLRFPPCRPCWLLCWAGQLVTGLLSPVSKPLCAL